MRVLRPILLAVVLASGFFYFTTYRHTDNFRLADLVTHPAKVEITEAAGREKVLTPKNRTTSASTTRIFSRW